MKRQIPSIPQLAAFLFLTACSTAIAAEGVRRVVTVTDGGPESVVLADGIATNVIEVNNSRVIRLWQSETVPVPFPVTTDDGASAGTPYFDGFRGASFYISELPGGDSAPVIPLHQHPTMDFITVLDGEIHLIFTDREVRLVEGDTLINAGTLHTWENRGDETCRIAVVTLAGAYPDDGDDG